MFCLCCGAVWHDWEDAVLQNPPGLFSEKPNQTQWALHTASCFRRHEFTWQLPSLMYNLKTCMIWPEVQSAHKWYKNHWLAISSIEAKNFIHSVRVGHFLCWFPDLHYKGKSFFYSTQSKSSELWVRSGDRTRVRAVAVVTHMLKTSMDHWAPVRTQVQVWTLLFPDPIYIPSLLVHFPLTFAVLSEISKQKIPKIKQKRASDWFFLTSIETIIA